ncbi:hypothetical protein LTR37_005637 [Vermiconidia calcicola]|uniref:Uncharacterized protein n=1 Tax=Vermiconidia calcicola TaxID=1690605 RepID=A0ACC3NIS6_9PEZI|nr:hypothetical protein LTR37_005637 [Vermiconidia calcicola]
MGCLKGTLEATYDSIDWSDSEPVKSGIFAQSALSISAGKVITIGTKIYFGNKDTPIYLQPFTYEEHVLEASTWFVVLSDTLTHQHWLLDGTTAILHLCLHWLLGSGIEFAYPKRATELWFPDLNSSTTDTGRPPAYRVLMHKDNRSLQFAEDKSMEDSVLQMWDKLRQICDRSELVSSEKDFELTLASRRLLGYEFRDVAGGRGRVEPRELKLEEGATDWRKLVHKLRAISLFGDSFGQLIRPSCSQDATRTGCRAQIEMPRSLDYLGLPMTLLKTMVEWRRGHTRYSVHLADDIYWTYPEQCFVDCTCGRDSSNQCTALITRPHKEPHVVSGEKDRSRHHAIINQRCSGAIIIGHCTEKLTKKARKKSKNKAIVSVAARQQPSDSGIDLNSGGSSSRAGASGGSRNSLSSGAARSTTGSI